MNPIVIEVQAGTAVRLQGTSQWTQFHSGGEFRIDTHITEGALMPLDTTTDQLDRQIGYLERSIEDRTRRNREDTVRLNRLRQERAEAAYPGEPVASRIAFEKEYRNNPKVYEFVAQRDPSGMWHVSGSTAPNGVPWRRLVDFMRQDNERASAFTTLAAQTRVNLG